MSIPKSDPRPSQNRIMVCAREALRVMSEIDRSALKIVALRAISGGAIAETGVTDKKGGATEESKSQRSAIHSQMSFYSASKIPSLYFC